MLVIGGGVIGLAVAWRAAQRGSRNVVVVDPSPGGGAAGVAAGMLAPVTELQYGEEPLLRLGMASNERYPAFAAELAEAHCCCSTPCCRIRCSGRSTSSPRWSPPATACS
ncbi:FAD-dependent oxidoreductase, partial [Kitasatospora sp. NPDC001539]|uniref:FAD-dependent oxidoreductase n=1 Tax=Kitasatospora sp. NPDC001539 TaxID=3154384 RepID=UPI00332CD41D